MILLPSLRAFVVWLANGETIQVFRMTKKDDGSFAYVAVPEEFPKQHKAPVINIGVADTGTPSGAHRGGCPVLPSGLSTLKVHTAWPPTCRQLQQHGQVPDSSLSCPGKFIMTASSDTTILIWDLRGEVLASINTNQMNNAFASVSPCGR